MFTKRRVLGILKLIAKLTRKSLMMKPQVLKLAVFIAKERFVATQRSQL
jgi:hypothetical protein